MFFHFMCPLRGYEVTNDITKPFSYISYTLSHYFAVFLFNLQEHTSYIFHLRFKIYLVLKKLPFDVPITLLWHHLWSHKTVFWINVTIFVRSSLFFLLLWVHDAFDFRLRVIRWIGIQLAFVWCAHYVAIDVTKPLSTSITWFLTLCGYDVTCDVTIP